MSRTPNPPGPGGPTEILAPAGDAESLAAALAAGADAVYFGLADGFNARARARNFELARLPELMREIHARGARGYLTLNTLVFDRELDRLEAVVRAAAEARVDALLVQDPAVALLAGEICPELALHASTQMTISSPEGISFARDLGISRVVAPRELSIEELGRLNAESPLELEVFVHGALCVSWSGQCLTSEAWGGRSANRGQCAQACRLPYELVVDGQVRPLGEQAYLLSPRDLAGWRHVAALMRMGVSALKIEGRQKGPAYVVSSVEAYRRLRDRILAGEAPQLRAAEIEAMAVAFSRGFSEGFFDGSDHQTLVDGRFPKHRGLFVGRVARLLPNQVEVETAAGAPALSPGDGVVFDAGHPEQEEPGGSVFGATRAPGGPLRLRFGNPGPNLARIRPGDRVWKTADAAAGRHLRQVLQEGAPPRRKIRFMVTGTEGSPLVVRAESNGVSAVAKTAVHLAQASGAGLDRDLLAAKLGRLGGTPFELEGVDASGLEGGLHLPVSALNGLRRELVARLAASHAGAPVRRLSPPGALGRLWRRYTIGSAAAPATRPRADGEARLIPLCRTEEQLAALLELGFREVELDWMELVGLERAVGRLREAGGHVRIATTRIQKPGERAYDERLARLAPDSLLVRHWGALETFRPETRRPGDQAPGAPPLPELHGDFSLNVANGLTARYLFERGLATITPAHDLDADQLTEFLGRVDPGRVTVALHHHLAMFHTEHCVYAHLLSNGRDFRDCGRPCERHGVSLRDRTGDEHPVVVDVGCRNTVFNARAQTGAAHLPGWLARGVKRFRVEFVRETPAEVRTVMSAYRRLLAGRSAPAEAVRRVGAIEKFGVTGGTLNAGAAPAS